tara:strand:+ start:54 stop:260 length:207 start_codon:yes stop_codon:yes gene_type:complete
MAMTSEVRRARFKARSDEYKKKLRDKALSKFRDWPELEWDARIDPELTWVRLLKGRRYNDARLYAIHS